MKKILTILVLMIVTAGILFLLGAFIAGNFDVQKWDVLAKTLLVILYLGICSGFVVNSIE